jgi:hypothetical protein
LNFLKTLGIEGPCLGSLLGQGIFLSTHLRLAPLGHRGYLEIYSDARYFSERQSYHIHLDR